jgi:glucose/arabinose dehydrogenase
VADDIDNLVYRYNLTPGGAAPVLTGTIADNSAYAPAIRSTGELFVGNYLAAGTINRFLSPLGTPIANGAISNVGLSYPNTMLFVDDELWVPNSTAGCGSDPSTLVRLAFDAQGNASVAGTVTSGMTGADRGIAWDPTTRSLFVSQCTPIDTIQHYQVAADHTVTALAPISGNGLHNPGGMIVTPWGELLVANEGTASSSIHGASLLRFSLGAQGSVTANGTITGQGLDSPFGLAFAPWGDLFVMSNSNAMLARFAFDASHAATQSGSYQLATPQNNAIYRGTAAIAIAPGASMPSAGGGADGSVADTGSDASAE